MMPSNNTCKVKVFISSSSCHYWKGKMEKGVVMGVGPRNGSGLAKWAWFHVSELFTYPDGFLRGLGHWWSDN